MLSFQDFFAACSGVWKTERIYHYPLQAEVERSFTEFRVTELDAVVKQRILSPFASDRAASLAISPDALQTHASPGFAIAFETKSETGEEVFMTLNALFVPDIYVTRESLALPALPLAAQIAPNDEIIQGIYLRDEGYSESGAIAGQFTYQPTRQTLEMTTYYRRSVAVDQMRFVAPGMRMRTIVTYQRPEADIPPSVITLLGFGVEYRQAA